MDAAFLRRSIALLITCAFAAGGCSTSRTDQGALFGGLTGAGLGALVGNAVGHTGAGAAIGAGVGAISGAAVGSSLDEIEAKNRAEIEARLGRPVVAGSVTIDEVLAMTQAHVAEESIILHIQKHGMARPLGSNDLIFLSQQGISSRVVEAMQMATQFQSGPPPQTVVVHERYVAPPPYYHGYWHPYGHYHRRAYRPGVSWGIAVGH